MRALLMAVVACLMALATKLLGLDMELAILGLLWLVYLKQKD